MCPPDMCPKGFWLSVHQYKIEPCHFMDLFCMQAVEPERVGPPVRHYKAVIAQELSRVKLAIGALGEVDLMSGSRKTHAIPYSLMKVFGNQYAKSL